MGWTALAGASENVSGSAFVRELLILLVWPRIGVCGSSERHPSRKKIVDSWPMVKPAASNESRNRPGEARFVLRPPLDRLHRSLPAPSRGRREADWIA